MSWLKTTFKAGAQPPVGKAYCPLGTGLRLGGVWDGPPWVVMGSVHPVSPVGESGYSGTPTLRKCTWAHGCRCSPSLPPTSVQEDDSRSICDHHMCCSGLVMGGAGQDAAWLDWELTGLARCTGRPEVQSTRMSQVQHMLAMACGHLADTWVWVMPRSKKVSGWL